VLLDACQIMLNVALRAGATVEAFEQAVVGVRGRLAGDEALENQAFTRFPIARQAKVFREDDEGWAMQMTAIGEYLGRSEEHAGRKERGTRAAGGPQSIARLTADHARAAPRLQRRDQGPDTKAREESRMTAHRRPSARKS
jgi:hypothetical protein